MLPPEEDTMLLPHWKDRRVRLYLTELPCWDGSIWRGSVYIRPLVGGLCNRSFVVSHNDGKQVARIGEDIAVHGIMQTSVQASTKAAGEIGISPKVIYSEPHLLVMEFLPGGCLRPEDFAEDEQRLEQIVDVLKRLHSSSEHVRGALTYFWPFQVVRNYIEIGRAKQSRLMDEFPEILRINLLLEQAIDKFIPVFTHNDTVPQNFMFDEEKNVWLIDWDYGGYGHPMFDLVGVSCNADMSSEFEKILFEKYYGTITDSLNRQLTAFKLILNLREYMWGMVQEVTSELGSENVAASMSELYPDQEAGYEGYTNMNRERFEANWDLYSGMFE